MTLIDWLHDAVGLTIVELALLDQGERRVTTWMPGRTIFLEYVVSRSGDFRQTEAWSSTKPPVSVSDAIQLVLDKRANEELV